MTRLDELMVRAHGARRGALMNQVRPLSTRGRLLAVGATRMPVPYYNKKGRQFFLTLKGKYVVRSNGKSLYGVKAHRNAQGVIRNLSSVPAPIRPKKLPSHL